MAPDATPDWTITQQTETTDMGPGGTYVTGVRVTFMTRDGHTGSVFVPQERYTVANVQAAVAARAAVMIEIAGLSG